MNTDLDTLATAFYVTIDDLLASHPEWAPERPNVGITPRLSDAELVTLAVIQALLGYTSEARFIRYATTHLTAWFPYLPKVDRIERSGLCRRAPNPDDARSSVLALTPAGRRRLDATQGSFEDELEVRLGAALTPERLASLASTVHDVRRHIADQQGSS